MVRKAPEKQKKRSTASGLMEQVFGRLLEFFGKFSATKSAMEWEMGNTSIWEDN